jgi:competence protein ComGC
MLKNEKGFTLIEMLIVLMIMTTLALIAVPSIDQNNKVVNGKSCEAMKSLVEGQAETYELENEKPPTKIGDLADYISEINSADQTSLMCPGNQEKIEINDQGEVIIVDIQTTS